MSDIIQVSDVLAGAPSAGGFVFPSTPAWVLPGALLDLFFASGLYWHNGVYLDPSVFFTFSRASSGTDLTAFSPAGASFATYGSDVMRIKPGRGLLVEEARTNFLGNSGAPATQTTGSLTTGFYCLWVNGTGQAVVDNGTATLDLGHGDTATQHYDENPFNQGYCQFEVTVAGTVIVTVSGSLNQFQLEKVTGWIPGDPAFIYPTSYIPTAPASTASRAADSISSNSASLPPANAIDGLWRASTGSAMFGFQTPEFNYGGVSNNLTFIDDNSDNIIMSTNDSINLDRGYWTYTPDSIDGLFGQNQTAGGWDDNTEELSLILNNDTVVNTFGGTFTTPPTGPVWIGNRATLDRPVNGYLSRMALWNTKLPDAVLQALTVF